MVEKRITFEEIKIKGKQNELRNMISLIKYIGVAKTFIKYASYFVDIQSYIMDKSHSSILSVGLKEAPETPLTFFGSIFRFLVFISITEIAQRVPIKRQKDLNIAALILFNVFSILVFIAINNEMMVSPQPTHFHDL